MSATASASQDSGNTPSLTPEQRRLVLIGISLASFMTPFGASMLNLSLPEIGATFGVSTHALGWVSTAYLFSSVLFLVRMARISDLVGRKKNIFNRNVHRHLLSRLSTLLAEF